MMYLDSSLAKNSTALAMSSGVPVIPRDDASLLPSSTFSYSSSRMVRSPRGSAFGLGTTSSRA